MNVEHKLLNNSEKVDAEGGRSRGPDSETLSINRRELSSYFIIGVLALFFVTAIGGLVWYLIPTSQGRELANLGQVANFPPQSSPYSVNYDGRIVWVVNTGGEIIVFDQRTPSVIVESTPAGNGCFYAWVIATQRFEDPCTGDKFELNGEAIIEAHQPRFGTRHLDRYPTQVIDDQLMVDLGTLIEGAPIQ